MDLIIYKFMSSEWHFAYVVAYNENDARRIMMEATTLEVEIVATRNASDFPYILEKIKHKPGIYLSYILPF